MESSVETESGTHHDRDEAIRNADCQCTGENVGRVERIVSAALGGSLLGFALYRRSLPSGLLGALVGAPLLARGATGQCAGYRALGLNTAGTSASKTRPGVLRGMNVVKSIVVERPASECYSFWLNFEKFPHFMDHLESVVQTGERTSHWVAKAPLGQTIEWDAEVVKTAKNRLIEWRSIEGSEVAHAGSVRFEPLDGDRRCKVTVTLRWTPPAGIAGFTIARLLGEEPSNQIEKDLERFRQVLEVGEARRT